MKYSDILFEKTCVSLNIQKECTRCCRGDGVGKKGCRECEMYSGDGLWRVRNR